MRVHGVLQALLVQHRHGRYWLIAGRNRLHAAIEAGLRRVPCVLYEVDDQQAEALASAARLRITPSSAAHAASLHPLGAAGPAALAQSLATLGVCANLVAEGATPLSRTVAADLIKAEVWRSTCLLNAVRALQRPAPAAHLPVVARRIADRIQTEFQAEQRLRGFEIESSCELPDGTVVLGDESLLVAAVSNAVLATLPLLEPVPGGRITLRLAPGPTGLLQFEVRQSVAAPPDAWTARAFDDGWTDRPGGATAALSMACVQAVAEAHQGRALASAPGRGTSIGLSIPARLAPRAPLH
jgi:signal transduction histidine kinase